MKVTDNFFEQVYNDTLLAEVRASFGPIAEHHVDLTAVSEVMSSMIEDMAFGGDRRGDVALVIPNEAGEIWLHTKPHYPHGIYRLMTGGIEPGETPAEALRREALEEAGFSVTIERCLAVITYSLTAKALIIPFVTYAFLTTPVSGRPQPTDPDEMHNQFKPVPPADLARTARQLRAIKGRFADWGKFRATVHQVVADCLPDQSL